MDVEQGEIPWRDTRIFIRIYMSEKRRLRHQPFWYDEPPELDSGYYSFRIEYLTSVSDRYNHWPSDDKDSFYEETDELPEYTGKLSNSLSLKNINKLVKENGLDEKDVYLTASFSDDYLAVEVVHIKKLNKKEKQKEKQEEYQEQYNIWEKRKAQIKENEQKRIQQQIEILQRQAEDLKNKK